MLKNSILFLIALLLVSNYSVAQINRTCGTMDHLATQLASNPTLANTMLAIEQQTAYQIANGKKKRLLVTIPVVFHIVYNTANQNISNAKCIEQLNQLNLDFAKLNTDASNIPAPWQGIAANTDIQFCLAVRDPNGLATSGIERRQLSTNVSFSTNDDVKYFASSGLDAWNSSQYLNFWVCNLGGGVLGYAQFPGGPAAEDGVVCGFGTVGSMASPGTGAPYDLGRTATHEVGHWLNLRHIWGDENACSGSDLVNDTPNQEASNGGCPTYPLLDACTGTAPGVMFMNYMDYVTDNCMYMFTAGQAARMAALFATGGARVSLLTSQGCVPLVTSQCAGLPPTGTITSNKDTFCGGGTAILDCNGAFSGVGGLTFQWQVSTNGGFTWANATGTSTNTSYTANSMIGVVNYQCIITCTNSGQSSIAGPYTLYSYGISSVDNDTTCSPGLINLIANGFGPINWYETPTSTTVINTGNTFNVTVTGDTTFYVNAVGAQTNYSVGPINNLIGTTTISNNYLNGERFRVFEDCTIDTVHVYPSSAGNVVINLRDSLGTTLISSFTFPVTAAQINTKVAIPVNFACTPGQSYIMNAVGSTVTGLYRNTNGAIYPYTVPNVISIFNTSNNLPTRYYYVYDWKLHTGCITARVPVNVHIGALMLTVVNGTICDGGGSTTITTTTTGGSNPYNYSLNGGTPNTTGIFTSITPGTYTIVATDANGCSKSTITTISQSPPVSLNPIITNAFCSSVCNGSIDANAAGGTQPYNFTLNGGAGQIISLFNNLCPTSYVVLVTDASGCSASSSLQITEPASMNTQIANQNIACYEDQNGVTTITNTGGTPPYTYSFGGSPFSAQNSYSNIGVGVYTVICQDANNCSQSYVVSYTQPANLLLSTVVVPVTNFNNGSITVNATGGTIQYMYSINGGASQTINVFSGLTAGTYTVTVQDAHGCTETKVVIVTGGVGINENYLNTSLNIAPNPSDGNITLSINSDIYIGSLNLKLMNAVGQVMMEQTLQVNGKETKKDIRFDNFAKGQYILVIKDAENRSFIRKLVFSGK
jgi:hypothetical protein